MDVEPCAVDALFTQTHCKQMIHGHTHRPAIHDLTDDCKRIVVGDWYEQGSVLVVSADGVELKACLSALAKKRLIVTVINKSFRRQHQNVIASNS